MKSYGYIFLNQQIEKIDAEPVDITIRPYIKKNLEELVNTYYQRLCDAYRRMNKNAELIDSEREWLYRRAQESYRKIIKEKTVIRKAKHLTVVSHSTLAIETTSQFAKRLSAVLPETTVCSVTGFDESIFQMCIFENGEMVTAHQIGDELEDVGLEMTSGDASVISTFFDVTFETAKEFTIITDVMDAEDYLTEKLASFDD